MALLLAGAETGSVWTAPGFHASGETSSQEESPRRQRRKARKLGPESVRTGYRQVLERLAAGEGTGALHHLVEVEIDAAGEYPADSDLEAIWRAKLHTLRDLAEELDPEILAPVFLLHHDAYLHYRDQRLYALAQHAQLMALGLAEVYAANSEHPQAKAAASALFASFAGYLQEGFVLVSSRHLFQRALEFDAGNWAALMGLGTLREKAGAYGEAIPYFERVLRLRPDHAEAKLRLALCLARSDQSWEAEPLLRELLAREIPEWVRALAYQELVRVDIERGHFARAEKLLQTAVQELPGNQRLYLELAYVLDRHQKPGESVTLLERLLQVPAEKESPRARYNRWPQEDLEWVRTALRHHAEGGLPRLAVALASPAAGSAEGGEP